MKKDNHYFAWGLTAVCVVCAVMLIYDLVFRDSIVMAYTHKMIGILAPILYGCAIAYLLAPIVNWFERIIFRRAGKRPVKGVRAISIVLTWVVVFALLYGLLRVLLPELYSSVLQLIDNARIYYKTIEEWVLRLLENHPDLARQAEDVLNEYYEDIFLNQHYEEALAWVKNNLMPQLQAAVQAVTGGVVGVLVFFKNLFLGIMVSMYLLASKENFSAVGCKLCYTLLPEDRAAWFIRGIKATDRIFSGFVRGKLLDSLIIGIICFVCSSILDFPYAPLVSVVVGVTNVIPFFGPFLGAIPSAFLILLASPIKCLYFIIFVLALQQFDGNILGPKILGDSTGISGFWVIVAILVGGGLWGVAGMFLGVPICACLYAGVRAFSNCRLKKKGLPVASGNYATHQPVWPEDKAEAPPEEGESNKS
ncbi:MAG: AI-2E family transporter [Oscillospiraceae bacterium]|nr:AI-2E family transporter [Oscillospiraceae bacterium]